MPENVQILLVEDNLDHVDLAVYALKMHNVANHIHVARDGAEALDFIFCTGAYAHSQFQNAPKLILLDLKLPLVDGAEVLRRVKADPRTHSIPVVVLTSSRERCDIVDSYRLGANSYIVKPVNFDEFTEAVRELGNYWLVLNEDAMPGGSAAGT